jgi:ferredoxin
MANSLKIHPLNAKGRYYVDQNVCTCSAACEVYAPDFFRVDEDGAYVIRQPQNEAEHAQLKEAIWACPVEAILDGDAMDA